MLKWVIIGFILAFAIFVMFSEYSLESQSERYRCYLRNEYKKNAHDDMCCGANTEKGKKECGCKHCRHYKNYLKCLKEKNDEQKN